MSVLKILKHCCPMELAKTVLIMREPRTMDINVDLMIVITEKKY